MAYDPYGGYDTYGNDTYGYANENYGYEDDGGYDLFAPPPPPDEDWVDPGKMNREYSNKIAKDFIHKEFSGLKKIGLFLLEVLVESFKLQEEIEGEEKTEGESEGEAKEKDKKLMYRSEVDFLDYTFHDVSAKELFERVANRDRAPSHTDLFQTVFTQIGRHKTVNQERDITMKDLDEESEKKDEEEGEEEDQREEQEPNETEGETEDDKTEEDDNSGIELMAGKAILVPKTGVEMIQLLQVYPVYINVYRVVEEGKDEDEDETTKGGEGEEGEAEEEGDEASEEELDADDEESDPQLEFIGEAKLRLPEVFRRVVLSAALKGAVLPAMTATSERYPLLDDDDNEVGTVKVTCALTCFGQSVVNCVKEREEEGYDYYNPHLMARLKLGRHNEKEEPPKACPPEFYDTCPPRKTLTSKEILLQCYGPRKPPCRWTNVAIQAEYQNWATQNFEDKSLKEKESHDTMVAQEYVTVLRGQRQICRDLKKGDKDQPRPQTPYDRLMAIVDDADWEELQKRSRRSRKSASRGSGGSKVESPKSSTPTLSEDFDETASTSSNSRPKSILKTSSS